MLAQWRGFLHQILSCADVVAIRWADTLILLGRIMVGSLFAASSWNALTHMPASVAYLANLGVPYPVLGVWLSGLTEGFLALALILGIGTRYAAAGIFFFCILATAIAHRYWEYPMPQQTSQYVNFLKNLSIMGGAVYVFVTGAGRLSLEAWASRR